MRQPRPRLSRSSGGFGLRRVARAFTLLEMVVVITIIAIIAGSLVPVITRPYITERRLETINEMGAIEEAIIGRPEYGDPGYLGTVGGLPKWQNSSATDIQALVTAPNNVHAVTTQPSAGPQIGVPFGWNGPYIKSEFEDPTIDAWGTPYVINTNVSGHDQTTWNIQSAGPDRVLGTGDDFIFPSTLAGGSNYFLSQGVVYVEIDEGYGVSTTPAPPGDLAATNPVLIWYPQSPQNGGNGLPTSTVCTQVLGSLSNSNSSTYMCPGTGNPNPSNLIPFGLPVVSVTLNNSSKFSALAGTNPANTWYQVVPHHRLNTYQKVVIPVSSLVGVAPATPFTSITPANLTTSGVVLATMTIPAVATGTLVTIVASGSMTLSSDANTYCSVIPQWNTTGGSSWANAVTTLPKDILTATQSGAWAQEGTGSTVSFTSTATFVASNANNNLVRFMGYQSSSPATACSFGSSPNINFNATYSETFSAP
jgi:prepilin-type N-terminal cleavage/methylation domain-containing protein